MPIISTSTLASDTNIQEIQERANREGIQRGDDNPRTTQDEVRCCSSSKCALCPDLSSGSTFGSSLTGRKHTVICKDYMSCSSHNVVYLITCTLCGIQYVGETSQQLRCRISQHRSSIRIQDRRTLISEHFSSPNHNLMVMPLEEVPRYHNETQIMLDHRRRHREEFWIKEIGTLSPYGLNDKLQYFGSISLYAPTSLLVTYTLFNKIRNPDRIVKHTRRRNHQNRNNRTIEFDASTFLNQMTSMITNDLRNFLHSIRKMILGLSKENIGTLDTFLTNANSNIIIPQQFKIVRDLVNYRLGLGTTYVQTPGNNRKSRVLLKLTYENKGLDKIGLAKILHSAEVVSTLPTTFLDKVPLICYRYKPSIAMQLFNFKEESQKTHQYDTTSMVCDCHQSTYNSAALNHIVTGDLSIIPDRKLRTLFTKGPKYRLPRKTNWSINFKLIRHSVLECQEKWARQKHIPKNVLDEWASTVLSKIRQQIEKLSKKTNPYVAPSVFNDKNVKQTLKNLHKKFVITTADKAGNNIVLICKKFYHDRIHKELGIQNNQPLQNNKTYKATNLSPSEILESHKTFYDVFKLKIPIRFECLPYIHWLPKLHKNPYGSRFIAASSSCSTTHLSKILTLCLNLVKNRQRKYYEAIQRRSGIPGYWIIQHSDEVSEMVSEANSQGPISSIKTYDFNTLYTNLPHSELKERIPKLIRNSFKGLGMTYISIDKNLNASWTKVIKRNALLLSPENIIDMLKFLLDNIFIQLGDTVFKQHVGIPMGTNCAPLLAELLLHDYESSAMIRFSRIHQSHSPHTQQTPSSKDFTFTKRYIDDLITVNNPHFDNAIKDIYPAELTLKETTLTNNKVAYLDRLLIVDNEKIKMSLYDKRDDFPFAIHNYPHLDSNIPRIPAYGVYITQLLRFAKACDSYDQFLKRHIQLVKALLNQGFTKEVLYMKFKQFFRTHYTYLRCYSRSVTHHIRDSIDTT